MRRISTLRCQTRCAVCFRQRADGATIPRSQTLVAFPHFNQVNVNNVPIGSQRYDSMQMKVQRRFSAGLAMQVAYTLSKTLEEASVLNAQDVMLNDLLSTPLERRLVEFDSPHSLAILASYELPWGRGRRFGSGMNRVVDAFVGGWNVNVQHVVRSGSPVQFPNAANLEARSAKFTHAQRDALAQKNGRPEFDPVFDVFFDTSLFPTSVPRRSHCRTSPLASPTCGTRLSTWANCPCRRTSASRSE